MPRTCTISMPVKQKTANVFDAILDCPQKLFPEATRDNHGWWSFLSQQGNAKLKFNSDRKQGTLNPLIIENDIRWNVPMKVVTSGDFSELIVTINKPEQITEQEFLDKVREAETYMENMKQIIEKN